jgi:hypothetical protein
MLHAREILNGCFNALKFKTYQKYYYLIPHHGILKIKYFDRTRASPGGNYLFPM